MRRLFNDEEVKWLINNINGTYTDELVAIFKKKFNRNINVKQLRTWRDNYNKRHKDITVKSGVHGFMSRFDSQKEWFEKTVPGKSTNEIKELYKKEFGIDVEEQHIKYAKRRYELKSNYNPQQYYKGHIPNNTKVVGTERITYDKRNNRKETYVKVANNKWVRKQKYIYEKYKGKLPYDSVIIFLDGNRENFELDNLKAVPRDVSLAMIGTRTYFDDVELNKTSIAVARLKVKQKKEMNV